MSIDEAVELARRSIYHATLRDGASGGVVSVYYVVRVGGRKCQVTMAVNYTIVIIQFRRPLPRQR